MDVIPDNTKEKEGGKTSEAIIREKLHASLDVAEIESATVVLEELGQTLALFLTEKEENVSHNDIEHMKGVVQKMDEALTILNQIPAFQFQKLEPVLQEKIHPFFSFDTTLLSQAEVKITENISREGVQKVENAGGSVDQIQQAKDAGEVLTQGVQEAKKEFESENNLFQESIEETKVKIEERSKEIATKKEEIERLEKEVASTTGLDKTQKETTLELVKSSLFALESSLLVSEGKLRAFGEITQGLGEKSDQSQEVKKESIEIPESKVFPSEFIESKVRSLLVSNENIKEVNNLEVKGSANEITLNVRVVGPLRSNIGIQAILESK